MKCEKCNEREAVLFYKANINGEKTEKNLCAECAQAEGFGELMSNRSGKTPMGFFQSPFESFFGGSMFPTFGRSFIVPVLAVPGIEVSLAENTREPAMSAAPAQTKEAPQPDAELCARRELNALRNQLEEAVKAEEFEKCIQLRDQIKALECR